MSSMQNTEIDLFKVGNFLRVTMPDCNEYAILEILSIVSPTKDYEFEYSSIFMCNMVVYKPGLEPQITYGQRFHWTPNYYIGEIVNVTSFLLDCDLGV
jgi:hypothetical protein